MSLVLVHTRYQLLETIRIPIAVIGTTFFPSASMLFFVVPFAGDHPVGATLATASMVTFAVMVSSLFGYGVGVSDDRSQPWDPYLRTLPVGSGPRFAGRILTGIIMVFIALIPVVVIAALFTEATATAGQLVTALGTLALIAVPFTLMGLAIGYSMPTKAALAVAQLVFFPLAYAGGLLTGPGDLPGWVEVISPYLPTRGAVELMWASVSRLSPDRTALVMLAVWTVVLGALAAWAYRRDEGRRFR